MVIQIDVVDKAIKLLNLEPEEIGTLKKKYNNRKIREKLLEWL